MARRGGGGPSPIFFCIYIYIYDYMYIWTRALALADVCDKPIYYMLAYVLWAIRIHAIGWQQSVGSRMCCVFAFHMHFKCGHSALESVCDINLSATRLRMEKIRTLHVVLVRVWHEWILALDSHALPREDAPNCKYIFSIIKCIIIIFKDTFIRTKPTNTHTNTKYEAHLDLAILIAIEECEALTNFTFFLL